MYEKNSSCWFECAFSSFIPFCQEDMESGDLAQLARASALQAEGQGFKSPNLHRKLLFDITRDGNDKHVMVPLWDRGEVKQHGRFPPRGAARQAWGARQREWGSRSDNMAKRIRARRRMPWGSGAMKAVASHERPGGAADAH